MRDNDDPIRYTIDEDTIKLLEAVLNNSETLADCQWDSDSADDIRLLNRELGERFGIEYTSLEIEESEDGDEIADGASIHRISPSFEPASFRNRSINPASIISC